MKSRGLKIGIVSQARMTSSRLPGKILKDAGGKSLLDWHVSRLSWSDLPIFVATTTNSQDDVVVDFCKQRGIGYFRGSESHVLSRYSGLSIQEELDVIVRVTSDCPLIDGRVIASAVDWYLQQKDIRRTYLTNCQRRTFPRGFDFEIFHASILEEMASFATQEYEFEHVTPYIWKTNPSSFKILHWTREQDDSRFRLTVDEPDDYLLIRQLIEKYQAGKLEAEQIIEVLHRNPDLAEINRHVEQKKV